METALPETILEFLRMAGLAVLIAAVGYVIAELLLIRLIRGALSRFIDDTWADFLAGLVRLGLFLLTGKIIIDMTGTAGALVVIVTAVTGAFAIGSERLASDVVSGVKLMFLNYYRVDEYVQIGDHFGKVIEVSMNATSLLTIDRCRIIIPNSDAINGVITNFSRHPGYRIKVRIPVHGDHDQKEALVILADTAMAYTHRLDGEDFSPVVLFDGIGAETYFYEVWIYVAEWPDTVYKSSDLRLKLLQALEGQGIKVGVAPVAAFVSSLEV